MDKIKVTLTGPIIRNSDGVILKVSHKAFAKEPGKVYVVPRNAFWLALVKAGRMVEVVKKKQAPQKDAVKA